MLRNALAADEENWKDFFHKLIGGVLITILVKH